MLHVQQARTVDSFKGDSFIFSERNGGGEGEVRWWESACKALCARRTRRTSRRSRDPENPSEKPGKEGNCPCNRPVLCKNKLNVFLCCQPPKCRLQNVYGGVSKTKTENPNFFLSYHPKKSQNVVTHNSTLRGPFRG